MKMKLFPLLLCTSACLAQEYDFGDLPSPYPTQLPNGARHLVTQALYIGNTVPDSEPDGLGTTTANGDDTTGTDDEDGVHPATLRLTAGVPFTLRVKVTNVLVGNAWLHGFADWNQDGDFADADESTKVMVPGGSTGVFVNLTFNVPSAAITTSPTALRLRLASDSALPAFGPAQDGEVEDYFIDVKQPGTWKDYGDLPDSAPGTAAGTFFTGTPPDYQTLAADGGPSHGIVPGLNFANDTGSADAAVDAEADGQPTPNVNGDDLNGDNDELGLLMATTSMVFAPDGAGSYFEMQQIASLAVQNITGMQARVAGFIDVNNDGDFDDTDEQAPVILVPGDGSVTSVNVQFKFKVKGFHPAMSFARSYGMRFRITTDASVGSTGAATDGEVMDSVQTMQFSVPNGGYTSLDFGDLPNKDYPTMYAQNGARHVITQTLFMGNVMPDGETDGQPTSAADGDDTNGSDDEDGFNPAIVNAVPGSPVNFPVKCANNTGNPATLYGFVDWNNDGDFLDAGEQATVGVPNASGGIFLLPWNVPGTAAIGSSVAVRLRLSTDAGLTPLGRANDGEVEDYFVEISQPLDFGDLPAPYPTKVADNGARHLPSADLYLGSIGPDVEADGVPAINATGDDVAGSDDEDVINASSVKAVPGFMFFMPVTLKNNVGAATLCGFIDWNGDGDFADANETSTKVVSSSPSSQVVKLEWNVPLTADTSKPIGVRLRLATGGARPPTGAAPDGEVEDFMITVMDQGIDYGDLPDSVAGTASGLFGTGTVPDYRTRAADGGPSHVMKPGLYFANDGYPLFEFAHLDPESDGQPSSSATGDDVGGEDDEYVIYSMITSQKVIIDGVHSVAEIEFVVSHAVTNTTGGDARVFGFLDVNSDGDFDDPGEQSTPIIVPTGSVNLGILMKFTFRVPAVSGTTKSFMLALRSRISTEASLGSDGPAKDGEVQDDLVNFTLSWGSFSSAMDYGDHVSSAYPTLWADNGARHAITSSLFIGASPPDNDVDGHPSPGADGDDLSAADDEDGFNPASISAKVFHPMSFPVMATNNTGKPAELRGFVDWNDDGDFLDAGETSMIVVPDGTLALTMTLPWVVPATVSTTAPVAVRLRLSTDAGLGPIGLASDGEVEDFRLTVTKEFDFGDLPDSVSGTAAGVVTHFSTVSQGDYRTRLADGGPSHVIRPDLALYNDVSPTSVHTDGESDGHPSANADGDDLDGSDDEDYLYSTVTSQTATGATATSVDIHYSLFTSLAIKNETGVDAYLTGFLDANNDGDFNDPGETASVTIPSSTSITAPGLTFHPTVHLTNYVTSWSVKLPVRFRLSTTSGLGPDGAAPDGEVEDYMISINFSVGQWWPSIVIDVPTTPGDGTIDIGTPWQMNPVGDFSSTTDIQWNFNGAPLQGTHPVLSTTLLQSLGTGRFPYHVSGRFGPRSLRSHAGFFDIKNLSTFRNFMGQHALNDATAAPDADADGDGISNFAEFVFGSDPAAQNAATHFEPKTVNSSGNNYFTLPYLRRSGGTENGARYETPDAIYFPEASQDLSTWTQPLTHVAPPSGLPTPPSGYEWGAVRVPTAMGTSNPRSFIRMNVLPP